MSQADELLSTLAVDYESEGHIFVGSDRHITVPETLKRIAVQHDHNIETVTFDCPRYWDGIDMSTMKVYINYMLSNGYVDSYPVTSVTVDEADVTTMHFDWTISKKVTQVDGKVTFLVCVKNTDEDGNLVNHWNSELCDDLRVSKGLESGEEYIPQKYPDILTEILVRLSDAENSIDELEQMIGDIENGSY